MITLELILQCAAVLMFGLWDILLFKIQPSSVYGAGGIGNGTTFTHADCPRLLTARILK
jgi:hypothetical protein